ncbi:LytR/AlgR family response regulator transcription factor [Zunongwangia endophytica]|uniref:LytR/AlgR family response regulator transcription factor n=1 Tax=Zunongwangia endophytica TaxID=1808945 RepID=A0ABV8HFB9_9FLAO|nr:LytTR family DNA-binding domain-containing protein [Zunongwangia endophytica]MDN3596622.1 LytTR family DNA-binding domain-containing protein [Zunongwangia endophytica]
MQCIIVDDEAAARIILKRLGSNNQNLEIQADFSNAIAAIKHLNQNEVDLIFLDIHMPDFNGFDFIQTIKNPPKIILSTSDRNFAIEAFEYECIVDYLVKPVTQERFDKAVKKALNFTAPNIPAEAVDANPKESGNDLYVNIDRRLIKIDIPSIYLIEARGDYILVKTSGKNYTVHSTMKKIEEKLPENLFLKIHRSFIINVDKIIDIEDNSVLIEKDVIPVSRSNRPELMKRLNLL